MIKPSHYDDDGYPIVWWRTILPSNSLAALNGLARDADARQVLGPNVRFNLVPIDECNRHVVPSRIIKGIRRRGAKALMAWSASSRISSTTRSTSPANSGRRACRW